MYPEEIEEWNEKILVLPGNATDKLYVVHSISQFLVQGSEFDRLRSRTERQENFDHAEIPSKLISMQFQSRRIGATSFTEKAPPILPSECKMMPMPYPSLKNTPFLPLKQQKLIDNLQRIVNLDTRGKVFYEDLAIQDVVIICDAAVCFESMFGRSAGGFDT